MYINVIKNQNPIRKQDLNICKIKLYYSVSNLERGTYFQTHHIFSEC